MLVDWAGDTMDVVDTITGEVVRAVSFAAVLPYFGADVLPRLCGQEVPGVARYAPSGVRLPRQVFWQNTIQQWMQSAKPTKPATTPVARSLGRPAMLARKIDATLAINATPVSASPLYTISMILHCTG